MVYGHLPLLVSILESQLHVLGEGLAFLLCKARHNSKQNLALGIHRIDVFFLEIHGNVLFFKLSDVFQAVQSISGKTADGLGNYHVNSTRHSLVNHTIELLTLFGVSACYTIVSKYSGKLPFRVFLNKIGVMLHLCLITGGLFITIRGNTAVCSNL